MRWKPRRPYPSPPTDHCSSSFAPQRGTGWSRLCFAYDSEEVPVCGVRSPTAHTPCSPCPSCPSPLQLVPLLPMSRAARAPPAQTPCSPCPSCPRSLLSVPRRAPPSAVRTPPAHALCCPSPFGWNPYRLERCSATKWLPGVLELREGPCDAPSWQQNTSPSIYSHPTDRKPTIPWLPRRT